MLNSEGEINAHLHFDMGFAFSGGEILTLQETDKSLLPQRSALKAFSCTLFHTKLYVKAEDGSLSLYLLKYKGSYQFIQYLSPFSKTVLKILLIKNIISMLECVGYSGNIRNGCCKLLM